MNLQQISDKAAIGLSALCVVHCVLLLLLPFLLVLIPPASSLMALNDEVFHIWLLFAVIPISVFALIMGYYHHRNRRVFALGAAGLFLLIIAALAGHDVLGEYGEVCLTVIGSVSIAFSHMRNFHLRRLQPGGAVKKDVVADN